MKYAELHKEAESILNRIRDAKFEFDNDNVDMYTLEEIKKLLSDLNIFLGSFVGFRDKIEAIIDSGENINNFEESTLEIIENINFYFLKILSFAQVLVKAIEKKQNCMDKILSDIHKL